LNYSISIMPKPALIVDFDNTIRFPKQGKFINGPYDFTLYPGVIEALQQTRDKGWLVFGLTNQGGVAYDHKTPETWEEELQKMIDMSENLGNGVWPFHLVRAAFMMEEVRSGSIPTGLGCGSLTQAPWLSSSIGLVRSWTQ